MTIPHTQPTLTLIRIPAQTHPGSLSNIHTQKPSTFGVLLLGRPRFVTLEPPDLNNQPNVSRIPIGTYTCIRHTSPRFGETFLLVDVPGRSEILFHSGNGPQDTKGCILVGTSFSWLPGLEGITNSNQAMLNFLRLLKGISQFTLEIR